MGWLILLGRKNFTITPQFSSLQNKFWDPKIIPVTTFFIFHFQLLENVREKGMTIFATEKRHLRGFQDLKDRFALRNQDLFRYLQLRENYNKKVKGEVPEEKNPVTEVMLNAYHQTLRITSKVYRNLMECQAKNTF